MDNLKSFTFRVTIASIFLFCKAEKYCIASSKSPNSESRDKRIIFPFTGRIPTYLDNSFKLVRRNGKTLVKKGAYVLARDERYHDGFNDSVEIAVDKQGNVRAKTIKTGLFDTILEYEIATVDGKTIKMCDYGSAGKAWDSGIDTKLTAWL